MKKRHILIVGICGIIRSKEDLNYFRSCLSDLMLDITFLERNNPPAILKDFSLNIVKTKTNEGDRRSIRDLDKINELFPFEALVCFSENLIQLSAILTERYNLLGNTLGTAICTTNKYEMRKELREKSVPVPDFYPVSNKAEAIQKAKELGFPCIIKPVQLYFSRGVKKIDSEADLEQFFDWTAQVSNKYSSFNFILIEKYVDGKEFSAEVVVNKGEVVFCGFTDKSLIDTNFRDEISHVYPYIFDQETEIKLRNLIHKTVRALNIQYGGCHIEFKIDKDRIFIIEVASRLGGGAIPQLVKLSTNVDLINMVTKIALQDEINIHKTRDQFAGIRFITCDQDCKIITEGIPDSVFGIPGILHANLLFEKEISIKPEESGCERIGYVIARNRDKDALIHALDHSESIIKNNLKIILN